MTAPVSVAIIGLGSRGLGVLERIITLAKRAGPARGEVVVEVIDPDCAGAGVHNVGQPDYLLLNTTAAQVSMFPDAHTVGSDVDQPGPNLLDWASERGLRIGEDGYSVGSVGRRIRPTDFLPRRVLGEYLGWVMQELQRRSPDHVQIRLHRAEVIDLSSGPDGGFGLLLSDGGRLNTAHVFLTTGYTPNQTEHDDSRSRPRLVADPYPMPDAVAQIEPGETVALGGFGLSAMDLMSCLTVGRGGRFIADGGRLRYHPSGREPRLLFFSRTGLPCRSRPEVMDFGPRYSPLAFTSTQIDRVRSLRGGQLDFDADLLPLVLTEMRVAYRRCQARLAGGDAVRSLAKRLEEAGDDLDALIDVLDSYDLRLDRFDPAALYDGDAGMSLVDADGYQSWLIDVLSDDLAEGRLGFARSPIKASLDIIRELRDTFRYAIDFHGLTDASLDQFHARSVPAINRAVVGPQFERHVELVALLDSGVATAPFGPAPQLSWSPGSRRWTVSSTRLVAPFATEVDWVVQGQVPLPSVECSASRLISSLYRRGVIRAHRPANRHVLGIDVDPDQHPIDANGRPDPRIWVLGPLCEGATFYNNLVPSPNTYSRPIFDAHRCVAAFFATATTTAGAGRHDHDRDAHDPRNLSKVVA